MEKDTIAAISTGMTNSGIGIVRISGPEAIEIADRIYKGKEPLKNADSHTIHYGFIKDQEETVDEVLVMLMKAPRTYTGEDSSGDQLSWWNLRGKKNSGDSDQVWSQTGRTRGVYQESIFERKDGSVSGRSSDRRDPLGK